jgi:predicted DNA binding CopG/RHH family protein
MSAKLAEDEFQKRFDAGEDIASLGFDLSKAVVEKPEIKRVNVDLPEHVLARLDRRATTMGVTRQSLIKMWLSERLDELDKTANSPVLAAVNKAVQQIIELEGRIEAKFGVAGNPKVKPYASDLDTSPTLKKHSQRNKRIRKAK